MEVLQGKCPAGEPRKSGKIVSGVQVLLRVIAAATSLASACVTMTNKQTVTIFGAQIEARYSYSPTFKFFAVANAVACAFSVVSLVFVLVLLRAGSELHKHFMLLVSDLVMMCLVLAGCSAATAIGYVGKYGNKHAGWMAICDPFHKFCTKGTVSLSFSYLCFLSFLALVIITAYKARK